MVILVLAEYNQNKTKIHFLFYLTYICFIVLSILTLCKIVYTFDWKINLIRRLLEDQINDSYSL